MENFKIDANTSSPFIDFDAGTGHLRIGGESYPENSYEFYAPVLTWLEQFLQETSGPITFEVTLSYLNTSSTKYMIDVLDKLEAAYERGISVSVEWYYDPDNDRQREAIEEFQEDFSMPFTIRPEEE